MSVSKFSCRLASLMAIATSPTVPVSTAVATAFNALLRVLLPCTLFSMSEIVFLRFCFSLRTSARCSIAAGAESRRVAPPTTATLRKVSSCRSPLNNADNSSSPTNIALRRVFACSSYHSSMVPFQPTFCARALTPRSLFSNHSAAFPTRSPTLVFFILSANSTKASAAFCTPGTLLAIALPVVLTTALPAPVTIPNEAPARSDNCSIVCAPNSFAKASPKPILPVTSPVAIGVPSGARVYSAVPAARS